MAVAIVIDDAWEAEHCLEWASRFAQAKDEKLIAFVLIENTVPSPELPNRAENPKPPMR